MSTRKLETSIRRVGSGGRTINERRTEVSPPWCTRNGPQGNPKGPFRATDASSSARSNWPYKQQLEGGSPPDSRESELSQSGTTVPVAIGGCP